MNRQQKELVVKQLHDSFIENQASFLIDYRGLTVEQMQNLRTRLREKGGRLQVAKARLMKRAADGVDNVQEMSNFFKDQVGLVFASDEPAAVAKVLHQFSKDNGALSLVVAYFDEQIIDQDGIVRIASLPSKDILLAQVCGGIQAPVTGFVNVLNILLLRLLWTLKEIEQKKQ